MTRRKPKLPTNRCVQCGLSIRATETHCFLHAQRPPIKCSFGGRDDIKIVPGR